MIEIDGSVGEGGGQILRTALSLSCLLTQPFRISGIRKSRRKPGLMPQHLMAVRAAGQISDAEVEGDSPGSMTLTFRPRRVRGETFLFDIGTAGSTMLVLQTLILPLTSAPVKSTVILKGGTHVPFSPCFDYINGVFLPLLARLGIHVRLEIESYGFYPKGGGRVRAEIMPTRESGPLMLTGRGTLLRLRGVSAVANLPLSIAERQKNALVDKVRSAAKDHGPSPQVEVTGVPSPGQGTFAFLRADAEHSVAGFTALGERGKRAEEVGEEAALAFLRYVSTAAALDEHLTDQIVPYLAMSRGTSDFTTSAITRHLLTNLHVIGLFADFPHSVEGDEGMPGRVRIR
ncbi:MAG: RNA 3'-terminal phosphate cyclase [Chloroflexota bacterium]